MEDVITVNNLKKTYGGRQAVKGISFKVHKGEVLGLLGPNGAGKSTTINILANVLSYDGGTIEVLGHEVSKETKAVKKEMGIIPQDLAIYEELSAEENVRFFASLYHIKRKELKKNVKEALESVDLYDRRNDKSKTFSGGMKRRLNIACGIAHKPQIIIMDEPTVGVDPQSRNHILELIKTLKANGITVIYSTHYMEEVEAIADRMIVMNEGNIIAEGTKEDLLKKVNNDVKYTFSLTNLDELDGNIIRSLDKVKKVNKTKELLEVVVSETEDDINDIVSIILKSNCKIENINRKEPSLEDIFLDLTGRTLRD